MLLEVGLAGGGELDGDKLVADGISSVITVHHGCSVQRTHPRFSKRAMMEPTRPRWTPSGLIAMKLEGGGQKKSAIHINIYI